MRTAPLSLKIDSVNTGNLPWVPDFIVINNPGNRWVWLPQIKKWVPPTYMNAIYPWSISPPTYEVVIGNAVGSDGQNATPAGVTAGTGSTALPIVQFIVGEPIDPSPGTPYGVVINAGSVSILGTPTVSITGTPSVNIANSPSVTITSGTVSISGTPTVSISNVPAVTINSGTVSITGTPSVNIANTPAVTINSGTVSISNITAGTVSINGNVTVITPATYANGNAVRSYGVIGDFLSSSTPAVGVIPQLVIGPFAGDLIFLWKVTWGLFNTGSTNPGGGNYIVKTNGGTILWKIPMSVAGQANAIDRYTENFTPLSSRVAGEGLIVTMDSALAGCAGYVNANAVTFFTGP